MKRLSLAPRVLAPVGVAALAVLATARTSLADTTASPDTAVVAPPAPVVPEPIVAQPVVAERTTSAPPNRPLVSAGVVSLVGAYVPSVIVAAANDNSYDHKLFLPVVGPWIDLGERPPCGGLFQTSCGTENGFKALLIIDGAFQGLGALATVIGLVTPEHHTTIVTASADAKKKEAKAHVQLAPASLGREAYGLTAFGNF